jgi:hypothetical protein
MARRKLTLAQLESLTYAELRVKFDYAARRGDVDTARLCASLLCSADDGQHRYRSETLLALYDAAESQAAGRHP